tara:strand:+ start:497 stop:1006 length:510 start_codon:yes stop_codon:yes gene_type:complete
MREDGGDALLSKKLNVNALVSLLPLSLTRKWRSLVGTPVSREEWKHVGIDDHLHINTVRDGDPHSLSLQQLHQVADFLDIRLMNNVRVYVYCRHGGGHSAVAILAYFMKHKRMGLREAYAALTKLRAPVFSLQSPWTALLSKFEASFRGDGSGRGSGLQKSPPARGYAL